MSVLVDAGSMAGIAAVESVVYLLRLRSAHTPSHWWSAATTAMTCGVRVGFVMVGARLALDGASPALAGVAYVASATICTAALHRHLERRKAGSAA